jgi:glutathione synthase/RimK-type ligase-like ATP-grasp enzyme
MPSASADIALLTERRFDTPSAPEGDWYLANILRDDRLLTEALGRYGLTTARLDWSRPDVDWSKFRCAVFRTTWDYFKRYGEFTEWLGRAEAATTLCNSPSIIRWNVDKHYLADLEKAGVAIVPSHFMERGSGATLRDALETTGWDEAIVKPCVSGGAYRTYRVNRTTAAELEPMIAGFLERDSFVLQPFMEDIVRTGEDTLMVLDGHYTHAVRKIAKAGDFRVQDDFGGRVVDHEPTREQIELAERAMAACPFAPVYGRVDMVKGNDGRMAIMELELLEPELWLRHHPPAAERMAEGIARYLGVT